MTPEMALTVAAGARRKAAEMVTVTRWFPAFAGVSLAAGYGLFGVGLMSHGSVRLAFCGTGLALYVACIASLEMLAPYWRQTGVVPMTTDLGPRTPWRRKWLSRLCRVLVVAATIFVVGLATGQIGWGFLVVGVPLGAAMWWQLAGARRAITTSQIR